MLWWLFFILIVLVTVAPLLAVLIINKVVPRRQDLVFICCWLSEFTIPVGVVMFVGWIIFGITLLVGAE